MRLSFAIGITGHRLNKIPADAIPRIEHQLSSIFLQIDSAITGHRSAGEPAPRARDVKLVSSLAEGSDQLAVLAMPRSWALEAILPCARERYLNDFAPANATGGIDRRPQFEAALAQAETILELPNEDDLRLGYERAGEQMLQRCDLLVAVWDGRPAAGRGGTEAIVKAAIEKRIPVVWIRSDLDQAPELIL
jgi:hypothetical protein